MDHLIYLLKEGAIPEREWDRMRSLLWTLVLRVETSHEKSLTREVVAKGQRFQKFFDGLKQSDAEMLIKWTANPHNETERIRVLDEVRKAWIAFDLHVDDYSHVRSDEVQMTASIFDGATLAQRS